MCIIQILVQSPIFGCAETADNLKVGSFVLAFLLMLVSED
jgi:hypothetical protein